MANHNSFIFITFLGCALMLQIIVDFPVIYKVTGTKQLGRNFD